MLLAMLTLPAAASAANYQVNMDFDVAPEFGGCNSGPLEECSLVEAINLANGDGGASTITFDPALERITFNSSPPDITQPVTIDGTDAEGAPGVELNGATEGKFSRAFEVEATGTGTTIEGVAINTFFEAVVVKANEVAICNSYLGTDLSGEVAEPNEIGVWVSFGVAGTQIGADCAGGGNVISGNGWVGILDDGSGTEIGGNLIGVGVGGAPLPNSTEPAASFPGGGILLRGGNTTVGGTGPGEGNVIAFNENEFEFGGGVIVQSASAAIRGNSIFANEGKGIYFWFTVPQPIPVIESASSVEGGATTVGGTISGEPESTYAIDLFANSECDKYESEPAVFTFAGEGEEFLGGTTANTNALGEGKFSASLPVQDEGTILTATATEANSTSEFSGCFEAPAVTPKPPPKPGPNPAPGGQPPILFLAPPAPENGDSVVVAPKAGTVFVTVPGGKKVKLEAGQTIPVGSIVDATRGKVTLTSINRKGETQTAVFFGGIFLVQQQEGSGLVVLKLRGPLNCGKGGGSGRVAKKGRHLWGSGHGNFRTEGNNGSATVRGTIWLTEDRCDGTFFKVRRGVVTIRDFGANETFPLGKGKSYLAQP
jgi:hypothetical protein